MRITYSGTPPKSILEYSKIRSIDYVHLDSSKYMSWLIEAEEKEILDNEDEQWFTVKNSDLVFYLDTDV